MAGRVVGARFWVDWDFNGSYTEETTYLISATGDMRLVPPSLSLVNASGIISQMTVRLRDASGRYSPQRTDGALYADIRDGKSTMRRATSRSQSTAGPTITRVFTGVLKLPEERTLSARDGPVVTFDARSMEEKFLPGAPAYESTFAGQHDLGYTESDYINTWLQTVGVVPATSHTRDAGMFVVPWAWLDDESAIEECWRIAAAAGGRFYADPDGNLSLRTWHWQTAAQRRRSWRSHVTAWIRSSYGWRTPTCTTL